MTVNIIQWNINNLIKKKNDPQNIVNKYNPIAICLQETNIIDYSYTPQFKNLNSFFISINNMHE
jgi:exonuclease III